MKHAGLIITLLTILLVPQLAFGFAPAPVGIFLDVSPRSQDVAAGGEATFTVTVSSVEGYDGTTILFVVDPPAGVSVLLESDTVSVPAYESAAVKMTVTVGSEVAAGTLQITLRGEDETDLTMFSAVKITLNISGGQPTTTTTTTTTPTTTTTTTTTTPPGEVVERTVTFTTTKITTVTTTTALTTNTPEVIMTTVIEKPVQENDLTLPIVTVLVVVSLLVLAGFALRRS